MRQRDIERLAAEAWNAAEQLERFAGHPSMLGNLLREIDPYGLLRPGAPQPSNLDETQDIPLRESPRMLRPTRDAWPPGTPRRALRLIGANEAGTHD